MLAGKPTYRSFINNQLVQIVGRIHIVGKRAMPPQFLIFLIRNVGSLLSIEKIEVLGGPNQFCSGSPNRSPSDSRPSRRFSPCIYLFDLILPDATRTNPP
jgi:hypothetical protein